MKLNIQDDFITNSKTDFFGEFTDVIIKLLKTDLRFSRLFNLLGAYQVNHTVVFLPALRQRHHFLNYKSLKVISLQ